MTKSKSVFIISLFGLLTGCSIWGSSDSKPEEPVSKPTGTLPPPPEANPPKVVDKDKNNDELFLQQARIMNRMAEIENELKQQREKIRLLEQGLLTGIAPDGLRKSGSAKSPKPPGDRSSLLLDQSEEVALSEPNLDGVHMKVPDAHGGTDAAMIRDGDQKIAALNDKLKLVQEVYQAGRFSVAISELGAISREFGENSGDGKIRLWVGKAYARLKEFSTARSEFEAYLKGWPSGEFVAEARLELAQAYSNLGLKERARGELRRVMKDFAGQEYSEIASAEFNKMQGGL